MNENYKLKNISDISEKENKKYEINFSDGEKEKTITLSGSGKIREAAQV